MIDVQPEPRTQIEPTAIERVIERQLSVGLTNSRRDRVDDPPFGSVSDKRCVKYRRSDEKRPEKFREQLHRWHRAVLRVGNWRARVPSPSTRREREVFIEPPGARGDCLSSRFLRCGLLPRLVVPDLAHYQRFLVSKLLNPPSVHEVRSNIAVQTLKAGAPLRLAHLE